jgi:hypothetical protein
VRQRRHSLEAFLAKAIRAPRPRTVGRVIATRHLHLPSLPGRPVTIRIGVPRRLSDGWDWGCPVEIHGLDAPQLRYVFGVDAFQALQLGLDYIAIRTSTGELHPYLFEPEDGPGFSRSLPSYLPLKTQQELQAVIDQAGERWAAGQKRRPARRSRKQS